MVVFPPITVCQPRPHDIVDDPVGVCGVGTGFEGVISARVRANNGRELRVIPVRAGATGIWGNFHVTIDLPGRPPTARGTLEVFEEAQDGSGRELNIEQGRRTDSLRAPKIYIMERREGSWLGICGESPRAMVSDYVRR